MKVFFCVASVAAASQDMTFREVSTTSTTHPYGYTVYSSTYLSPVMNLKPGQVIFTNSRETPMKMPEGGSMLTGFRGEVVDGGNKSVPLTFVYDHHWIVQVCDQHVLICLLYKSLTFSLHNLPNSIGCQPQE
jgi:hypothetical protein